MSKQVTISSLVRQASKSEAEFVETLNAIFEERDAERVADFFDRLNIPRSVEGEAFNSPLGDASVAAREITNYDDEAHINRGIQKYMDRHLKKLKWHAQRPSVEGTRNVLLLMRESMIVTELRLRRLRALMMSKDELTPEEWSIARDLMNRAYLSFRHFLIQLGGAWIDACLATLDREELAATLGNFYEIIDQTVRKLEEHRHEIEERRVVLSVLPPGHPPVKPPIYFGGDIMGRGPWKQFWSVIEDRAHHFREALA
jgi:hypothetical protein